MTPAMTLRVARVGGYDGPLPAHQTAGAAGLDLYSTEVVALPYSDVRRIPTGIAVEIPPGHVGLIRGRSGLASKCVIVIEGTIDEDYRGEVSVLAVCFGRGYTIEPGQRIAQLVIAPYVRCEAVEASLGELTATERGAGGFGSTGAS